MYVYGGEEYNKYIYSKYDEVTDTWERAGYECIVDEYMDKIYIINDTDDFTFDLKKRTWYAYDRLSKCDDTLEVEIKHMDLICETGSILGWWK